MLFTVRCKPTHLRWKGDERVHDGTYDASDDGVANDRNVPRHVRQHLEDAEHHDAVHRHRNRDEEDKSRGCVRSHYGWLDDINIKEQNKSILQTMLNKKLLGEH